MKILRISLGILAALTVVLVIHIYMATHKEPIHNANIQLARIDMMQPIDSTQAVSLRSHVKHLPGVKSCYVNVPAGTLVYAYQLDLQNKEAVYAQVASISPVPVKEFVVDAKDLANGCPAMDHSSLEYRFARWVKSW